MADCLLRLLRLLLHPLCLLLVPPVEAEFERRRSSRISVIVVSGKRERGWETERRNRDRERDEEAIIREVEEMLNSRAASLEERLGEKIESRLAKFDETLKSGLADIFDAFGVNNGGRQTIRRSSPSQFVDTGQPRAATEQPFLGLESMAETRASSMARLAAATNREDQLREIGCYLLQWQEDTLSRFAQCRAGLRGSLHSIAPNKDELMREESEFDQKSSSIFGGNKGTEANSDIDASSMHQKVESNLVEAKTKIDSGGLVENPAQDDIPVVNSPQETYSQDQDRFWRLGTKSVEQSCVNHITFPEDLQVITTPLELVLSRLKQGELVIWLMLHQYQLKLVPTRCLTN